MHRTGPRRPWRILVPALAAVLLAGCGGSDPSGPDPGGVPGEGLFFLRPAVDAPPVLTSDTTVVATRGEQLRVELFYADEDDPSQPGDRFLRFDLREESLLRYPEDHPRQGGTFQPGDTISIHISVSRDTLSVDMGPDGLRFADDEPAELEITYRQADDDFDDDGEADPELEENINMWRQETPGSLWFRETSFMDLDVDLDEVEADITSFTVYALAI